MPLRERLVDGALLLGVLLCAGVLLAVARKAIVHILSGFLFAGTSAYTVSCGMASESRAARLAWFVATGAVLFLFGYWAFTVVFPPPAVKTAVGCGGVRFINKDGDLVGPPGQARDEL